MRMTSRPAGGAARCSSASQEWRMSSQRKRHHHNRPKLASSLPLSVQKELLVDLENLFTNGESASHISNSARYGGSGKSKTYKKAVYDKVRYYRKLKEEDSETYWRLVSDAFAGDRAFHTPPERSPTFEDHEEAPAAVPTRTPPPVSSPPARHSSKRSSSTPAQHQRASPHHTSTTNMQSPAAAAISNLSMSLQDDYDCMF